VFAVPLAAAAQQAGKMNVPRIGLLALFSPDHRGARELFDAFRQGLRELGDTEGQNVVIEFRSAQGRVERLPELFAEAVRLNVDVILLQGGTPAARAAKQATITIPIVAPAMADPVRDGVVTSLGRPGGNITGSSFLGPGLVPKRIELLKQAMPGVSRVAALRHPAAYADETMKDMLTEAEVAARTLSSISNSSRRASPTTLRPHSFP
jgi:putative ABC transport system substrate-binding protein